MQIQLKQSEIVSALKQYIAAQGITLAGKNVEITFTASRSAAGIVADISIEDFISQGDLFASPNVTANAIVPPQKTAEPQVTAEPEPEYAEAEEPAARTASLFS